MENRPGKGYVLIMTLVFTIIIMAATAASSIYVLNSVKIDPYRETERVKGYYADMAALRYATAILLADPAALGVGTRGSTVTKSMANDYPTLFSELGLSRDVTIVITHHASDDFYDVSASYSF